MSGEHNTDPSAQWSFETKQVHAGQQPDEVRNIRRVQPGRRFIENKDR